MIRLLAVSVLVFVVFTAPAQVVKDYSLRNLDNELTSLHAIKGDRLTVVDFWTTWCKPCKKAIPELNKIYRDFEAKGVQIIGVNCDGPRTVAKVPGVSKAMEIVYPVLIDVNSDVANSLNIGNFPTLVILDDKFRVRYFHEGFIQGDEQEIIKEIQHLLNK